MWGKGFTGWEEGMGKACKCPWAWEVPGTVSGSLTCKVGVSWEPQEMRSKITKEISNCVKSGLAWSILWGQEDLPVLQAHWGWERQ